MSCYRLPASDAACLKKLLAASLAAVALLSACGADPATSATTRMDDGALAGPAGLEVGKIAHQHLAIRAALPEGCYNAARRPECGIEREAVVERRVARERCRRPEFGIEGYAARYEEYDHVQFLFFGGSNFCRNWGNETWMLPHLLEEARSICEHENLGGARQAYGPDATVSCDKLRFVACEFGGANTYIRYHVRMRFLQPIYHERSGDPACPEHGPASFVEVTPALYRECRHILNGVDPNAGCVQP